VSIVCYCLFSGLGQIRVEPEWPWTNPKQLLVDVDSCKHICRYVLIEREQFAFHVDIAYEKHHEFCCNYQSVGHHISHHNKLNHGKNIA